MLIIILWTLKDKGCDQIWATVKTKTAFYCSSFFSIVLYFTVCLGPNKSASIWKSVISPREVRPVWPPQIIPIEVMYGFSDMHTYTCFQSVCSGIDIQQSQLFSGIPDFFKTESTCTCYFYSVFIIVTCCYFTHTFIYNGQINAIWLC